MVPPILRRRPGHPLVEQDQIKEDVMGAKPWEPPKPLQPKPTDPKPR